MGRKNIDRRAITLIELIIVVALVGVIFIAGATAIMPIMQFYQQEYSKYRATDDLTVALYWITKDVMLANYIDAPPPGPLTLRITNYENSADLPDYVRYVVENNTQLKRKYYANKSAVPLGTDTPTSEKIITSIIDKDRLPQYGLLDNKITFWAEMYTKDTSTDISAHKAIVVKTLARSAHKT